MSHPGTLKEKLITLPEAANLVKDGSSIVCPSFGYEKVSFAFIRELIRQKKKNLYLYGSGMNVDADMLIGAGCIKNAEIGHIGFENIGLAPCFRRAAEAKKINVEDYSNFIMTMRFFAGGMGIPFMPLNSELGSDIVRYGNLEHIREINDPFTNEKFLMVRAVHPDFAVLHVQRVDTEGNVSIEGPRYDNVEKAKSAKKVIVTCEEIVKPSFTRSQPEKTILPSFLVDYIVPVPFGAHPYACYGYYDYDWEHIELYAQMAKTEEGFNKYLSEFILSCSDEAEYRAKIGIEKILALRSNQSLGYSTYYEGIL
jgi:acyl CoA:acetate/3-ketoacid CoA transferase alpha subunit